MRNSRFFVLLAFVFIQSIIDRKWVRCMFWSQVFSWPMRICKSHGIDDESERLSDELLGRLCRTISLKRKYFEEVQRKIW